MCVQLVRSCIFSDSPFHHYVFCFCGIDSSNSKRKSFFLLLFWGFSVWKINFFRVKFEKKQFIFNSFWIKFVAQKHKKLVTLVIIFINPSWMEPYAYTHTHTQWLLSLISFFFFFFDVCPWNESEMNDVFNHSFECKE